MSENRLLTLSMLTNELGAGKTTVKFWLNRFNRWLPYSMEKGQKLYHPDSLNTLVSISDKFQAGMLPTEIEKALDEELKDTDVTAEPPQFKPDSPEFHATSQGERTPTAGELLNSFSNKGLIDQDSSRMLSDFFDKISANQERMTLAHERSAAAEEKKAEAMEKRADAEAMKARAMDNLADSIRNAAADFLSSLSASPSFTENLSPPTAEHKGDSPMEDYDDHGENEDLSLPSDSTIESDLDDTDNTILEDFGDVPQFTEELLNDLEETPLEYGKEDQPLDNRMDISDHEPVFSENSLSQTEFSDSDLNDLPPPMELESPETVPYESEMDFLDSDIEDLSTLIEEDASQFHMDDMENDLDDLSALIKDHGPESSNGILQSSPDETSAIDDLTALIDEDSTTLDFDEIDQEKDDLTTLIGEDDIMPSEPHPGNGMDDLTALIGEEESGNKKADMQSRMDDLTALLEDEDITPPEPRTANNMDDLNALIGGEEPGKNKTDTQSRMDDLAALVGEEDITPLEPHTDNGMDDLNALIGGEEPGKKKIDDQSRMDDLTALVGEEDITPPEPHTDNGMDDLNALIGSEESSEQTATPLPGKDMDDLAALTGDIPAPAAAPPTIKKPKASFENNFEQFKAEVINIIIKLKKDDYNVDETTELLNSNGIKTLSGKNKWNSKMISKIYSFIEAAAK